MADIQTSTWSETAASNNATPPDGFPEGMAYSAVNDGVRETMAAIKREWNRSHPTLSTGGTSTAYTLTYTSAPAAYVTGMLFSFKMHTACGASPTLNVNALGALAIKKQTSSGAAALAANELAADHLVTVAYDSTLNCFTIVGGPAVGAFLPVGTVSPYAGSSAPTGWLLCYGQAVSRTTYAALFAIVSTTYGAGDGATTFNVPDMRGRAAFGVDNMGGSAASRVTNGNSGITGTTLGAAGGDERLHQHTHTATDAGHTHTVTDPGHTHNLSSNPAVYGSGVSQLGSAGNIISSTAVTATSSTTGVTVNSGTASITVANAGSGAAQNMPPAMMLNFIIYAGA